MEVIYRVCVNGSYACLCGNRSHVPFVWEEELCTCCVRIRVFYLLCGNGSYLHFVCEWELFTFWCGNGLSLHVGMGII